MVMKLKDLLSVINTDQSIRLRFRSGEEYYPTYVCLERFNEYYVTEIWVDGKSLCISVREEI